MDCKTISLEDFKIRSHSNNGNAFEKSFVTEVQEIIKANTGKCLQLISLEDAMKSYKGIGKASPTKIIGSFFIMTLKKSGYKDASKNRISINRGFVNLRL